MIFFDARIFILVALFELGLSHPEGRIVGGYAINITDAPYQVSFFEWGSKFCGGSVISRDFVLSAAHCFPYIWFPTWDVCSIKIRAGSTNCTKGGVVIDVLEVFVHEKYVDWKHDYDIAIAKLASTLEFSEKIQPIQLPTAGDQTKDGEIMIVSGWGVTKSAAEDDGHLRAVEVPIVNKEVCKKAYPLMVTENMICAGYNQGGKDSCFGDSGGPMVRKSDKLLIGIVSWGIGCAEPTFPGVYVKVQAFRPWIQRITGI